MSSPEKEENVDKKALLQWESRRNLWLGLVCWTVGLGNCWRFTSVCSSNGNGTFLVPYLIESVLIAIPLASVEMGLGQFSNKGTVGMWDLCPLWKGTGYASIIIMVQLMLYYNNFNMYILHFLFASMSTVVPWSTCDTTWAELNCYTFTYNFSMRHTCNDKYGTEFCNNQTWEHSAYHYWKRAVLNTKPPEEGIGHIRWKLMLCSSVTAFLIFLLNCKGTKSYEKVLVFCTFYPYIALIVMLFGSLIVSGDSRGLQTFVTPDLSKLATLSTWLSAFEQIVFSIGLGIGGLKTFGSHCSFRNPIHLEVVAINFIDMGSSICYCLLIYNILGALSYKLNVPLKSILKWKGSILFSKIPLSLLYLPGMPQLWGILFYSSIYTLHGIFIIFPTGLRSQGLMMASLLSTIYELYPRALNYTVQCSAVCSVLIFFLGYPYLTQGGWWMVDAIDNVVSGSNLITVCFMESVGVICIYGLSHFVDDMHFMLGYRSSAFWQLLLGLSPVLLGILFLYSQYRFVSTTLKRYNLTWIKSIQWLVFSLPLVILIIGMLQIIIKNRNKRKCSKLLKPSPAWGPTDPILKKSREMFSAHAMTKEYMYRQNRLRAKPQVGNEDEYEFD